MADSQKDYALNGENGMHVHPNELERIRTAGSISIPPELFERLYLSPENKVKGDLRKTFGNPTPIALIGFLLSLTPLSIDLMGWRGSGGSGAAGTATYFYCGGLLMIIGAILEFFLGNTFPFVVFGSYGAFWLSYGGTLQPFYNAAGAYAEGDQGKGLASAGFVNSFAFFLLACGMMSFIFMIAALRTNIVFFLIFVFLVLDFSCLAGAFWHAGQGNADLGLKLQKAGGATGFVVCALGWYIFTSQMLLSVDFPFSLPVGDLSTVVKGASDRNQRKAERSAAALQRD